MKHLLFYQQCLMIHPAIKGIRLYNNVLCIAQLSLACSIIVFSIYSSPIVLSLVKLLL